MQHTGSPSGAFSNDGGAAILKQEWIAAVPFDGSVSDDLSAVRFQSFGAKLRKCGSLATQMAVDGVLGQVQRNPLARLNSIKADMERTSEEIAGWLECEKRDLAMVQASRLTPWLWQWQARRARKHIDKQIQALDRLREEMGHLVS